MILDSGMNSKEERETTIQKIVGIGNDVIGNRGDI